MTRQEYYERSVHPIDLEMFLQYVAYNDCKHSPVKIEFKELAWNQTTREKVIKKLGNPRYSISKTLGTHTHAILFYRERLIKDDFLVQLHFLNELFFFGCYTFREWNPAARSVFKNIILGKYSQEPIAASVNPIKLIDSDNNKLILVDSVNMHIGYFTGEASLHEMLELTDKWQKENTKQTNENKVIKLYSSF
jgi:hypothetical protein